MQGQNFGIFPISPWSSIEQLVTVSIFLARSEGTAVRYILQGMLGRFGCSDALDHLLCLLSHPMLSRKAGR